MSDSIRTIIGMRGEGKTTLANHFIKYRTKPVIIVDPLSQFQGQRFFDAHSLLDHALTRGITLAQPLIATIFEQEDFNIICQIAVRHKNVMLVIDEVDMFDSPHSVDKDFKRIIHLGRHFKLDLVTTSRRPANISRDLTSQTAEFYIFKVTEKRDLDYFAERSSELPDKIKALKKYHYIKYDHKDLKICPPIK